MRHLRSSDARAMMGVNTQQLVADRPVESKRPNLMVWQYLDNGYHSEAAMARNLK